jgi:Tfp pilus assembly protein PilN
VRPISINLAMRPFYNSTLYAVAFALGLALLVGMTAFNGYTFLADRLALGRMTDARSRLEAGLDDLDRQEAHLRREVSRISLPKVGQQSAFARDAILQREMSWTELFNRLERVQPPNVRVRSIRPSIDQSRVKIRVVGIAQNYEAFTQFEEALLGSAWFSEVYPASETWNEEQRGIGFDLSFAYDPDAGTRQPAAPQPAGDAAAAPPAGPAPPAAPEAGR